MTNAIHADDIRVDGPFKVRGSAVSVRLIAAFGVGALLWILLGAVGGTSWAQEPSERESTFWELTTNMNTKAAAELFLQRFPDGFYAEEARQLTQRLGGGEAAAPGQRTATQQACDALVPLDWGDHLAVFMFGGDWNVESVGLEAVAACQLAIEETPNDLRSHFQLAWAQFDGQSEAIVPKLEWLAEQNHLPAKLTLGEFYLFGFVSDEAQQRAQALLREAAAEFPYARALLKFPSDFDSLEAGAAQENVSALRAEVEAGNIYADIFLGMTLRFGSQDVQDEVSAFLYFLTAAGNRIKIADYLIASAYEEGAGVARDLSQAVDWYQAAVGKGWQDREGKIVELREELARQYAEVPRPPTRCDELVDIDWNEQILAFNYMQDWQLDSTSPEAVDACRLAVEMYPGDPQSEYQLALALGGSSLEAISRLENLVALDYVPAAMLLGEYYFFGPEAGKRDVEARTLQFMGYPENEYTRAILWYPEYGADQKDVQLSISVLEREVSEGNVFAHLILAEIYEYDYFDVQNEALALENYLAAANGGLTYVSLAIASMLAEGRGAEEDLEQALAWYERAQSDGWLDPDGKIASLKERIAAEQPSADGEPVPPVLVVEDATAVWTTIQDNQSIAVFEAFIAQFPNSVFAALARARIDELRAGN